MAKRILFVGGNPRSGTTALNRVLDAHPKTLISRERYVGIVKKGAITGGHFEKAQFLDEPGKEPVARIKRQFNGHDPEKVAARYDGAQVIGDKVPMINLAYKRLWDAIPDCQVLYIVRNPISVAESYQARKEDSDDGWYRAGRAAIAEWNRTVRQTVAALDNNRNITVVSYELLYSDIANIDLMFEALGLDPAEADRPVIEAEVDKFNELKSKPVPRDEELRYMVALRGAYTPYRRLLTNYCILTKAKLAANKAAKSEQAASGGDNNAQQQIAPQEA